MRLSKDDEGQLESASITTQKKMLVAYAQEYEYHIFDTYIDDGYSGTNFERPNFKRMIKDIEEKKVNMVITKDLSRLGRDYIMSGQYTEIFFPLHSVRYIAINDGYDSNSPYNDIAPFKNVMNEMYARDISKKIKSAITAKMKDGCYIGNFAPYGYMKDPKDKNHLIIDGEASAIVTEIFGMAEIGYKPKEIADKLNSRNVLTPALYRCMNHPHLNPDYYTKNRVWTSSTISKILHNVVYLGHLAQGKTNKVSIKSYKTISNSKEEWIIVKGTHEAIITQKTYDNVMRQLQIRRKKVYNRDEECAYTNHDINGNFNSLYTANHNIFTGIAKCMDCGRNMSLTGTRKKGSIANLVCGRYKLYGSKECTNHFIDYESLTQIVREELKTVTRINDKEKEEITNLIKREMTQRFKKHIYDKKKLLQVLKTKSKELDERIQRLYEDNLCGKIINERYLKLYHTYENEQVKVEEEITKLKSLLVDEDWEQNIDQKIEYYLDAHLEKDICKRLEKSIAFKELNSEMVHEWIEKIEISQGKYEGVGRDKKKLQQVKIYYRYKLEGK